MSLSKADHFKRASLNHQIIFVGFLLILSCVEDIYYATLAITLELLGKGNIFQLYRQHRGKFEDDSMEASKVHVSLIALQDFLCWQLVSRIFRH